MKVASSLASTSSNWCVVAVGGRCAGEPGCAVGVFADRGDRGKAAEAGAGESRDDEFAAEPEFLAERVLSGSRVAGQQRGPGRSWRAGLP